MVTMMIPTPPHPTVHPHSPTPLVDPHDPFLLPKYNAQRPVLLEAGAS